ncbi:hypothetical protein [Aquimarina agarilytica]|uniref:hypothetical protein n=1 Tax=Aquimarina agarilytica TaxID=1087449 RepID=UPI0002888F31|nr:hypothetical protein [Aquimarina agarilytica]
MDFKLLRLLSIATFTTFSISSAYAQIDGSDLTLGKKDGREQGVKKSNRALVHAGNDQLILNYAGDFEGGTFVHSNLTVNSFMDVGGSDFRLGRMDGRDQGSKKGNRALVHTGPDILHINFNGDFEGGVVVEGERTLFDGKVGIGTRNPQNKLSVNGTIWAKEVKVSLTDAADWVFEADYKLQPLAEVEAFIKRNKHLPEMPSADEFRANDMKVSEMTNKLLQKIEELTLYTIEQEKEIQAEKDNNKALEARLAKLEVLLLK